MKPNEFIERYGQEVVNATAGTGVFASVTLAQAACESAWGASAIGNNLFGILGHNQTSPYWNGETITANDHGNLRQFRKYNSTSDSIKDHTYFLQVNSRYKKALQASTPEEQARELQAAGYAESKTYANTLIALIDKYNLKEWDQKKKSVEIMENKYLQIFLAVATMILAGYTLYKNLK